VFLGDLGGDELDDGPVDLEVRQVDGRDAVLSAQERGDVVLADEAELDEVRADAPAGGLLLLQRLVELLPCDERRLDQHVAKANGAGCHRSPLVCARRAAKRVHMLITDSGLSSEISRATTACGDAGARAPGRRGGIARHVRTVSPRWKRAMGRSERRGGVFGRRSGDALGDGVDQRLPDGVHPLRLGHLAPSFSVT